MGNPQCEDGYTRIANELLEAVYRFDFSKRQLRVLLCLIRQTYGYGRKADTLTVSKLAELVGMHRPNVSAALDELVVLNAVSKQGGHGGYLLEVNKKYRDWGECIKTRHVSKRDMYQNDTKSVSKRDTQKKKEIPPSPPLKGGISPHSVEGFAKPASKAGVKLPFGEHQFVRLTADEHDKLVARFGEEGAAGWIEKLDLHIGSKGAKYKSHYLTVLNWARMEAERGGGNGSGTFVGGGGKRRPGWQRVLDAYGRQGTGEASPAI